MRCSRAHRGRLCGHARGTCGLVWCAGAARSCSRNRCRCGDGSCRLLRSVTSYCSLGLTQPISEIKAELFRALANPAHVRALEILAEGERSVSELQPLVGIESSHLSQRSACSAALGLVTTRKVGSSVIYTIRDRELVTLLASAKRLLINSLRESNELLAGLASEPAGP